MELPNKFKAYVPGNKILEYLLSETHSVGKSKARFFRALGYDNREAGRLEEEFVKIAQTNDVKKSVSTLHGTKYVIDGELESPKGVIIRIRTIWIIETGEDRPRFVTAYPPD
ncbi:MAG: DUF6883 domain-containing protein [Chloroflexota bacterium]